MIYVDEHIKFSQSIKLSNLYDSLETFSRQQNQLSFTAEAAFKNFLQIEQIKNKKDDLKIKIDLLLDIIFD